MYEIGYKRKHRKSNYIKHYEDNKDLPLDCYVIDCSHCNQREVIDLHIDIVEKIIKEKNQNQIHNFKINNKMSEKFFKSGYNRNILQEIQEE